MNCMEAPTHLRSADGGLRSALSSLTRVQRTALCSRFRLPLTRITPMLLLPTLTSSICVKLMNSL